MIKKTPLLGAILGSALLGGIPPVALPKMAYKVGAIFAVAGRASTVGEPQGKTVEMIEQWINTARGIDGHPLDAIICDAKGNGGKAEGVLCPVGRLVLLEKLPIEDPHNCLYVLFPEEIRCGGKPLRGSCVGCPLDDR